MTKQEIEKLASEIEKYKLGEIPKDISKFGYLDPGTNVCYPHFVYKGEMVSLETDAMIPSAEKKKTLKQFRVACPSGMRIAAYNHDEAEAIQSWLLLHVVNEKIQMQKEGWEDVQVRLKDFPIEPVGV